MFSACSPRRSRSSVEARPGAGPPGCGKVVVDSMYAWNRGGFFFLEKDNEKFGHVNGMFYWVSCCSLLV